MHGPAKSCKMRNGRPVFVEKKQPVTNSRTNYEPGGREFESLRARQFFKHLRLFPDTKTRRLCQICVTLPAPDALPPQASLLSVRPLRVVGRSFPRAWPDVRQRGVRTCAPSPMTPSHPAPVTLSLANSSSRRHRCLKQPMAMGHPAKPIGPGFPYRRDENSRRHLRLISALWNRRRVAGLINTAERCHRRGAIQSVSQPVVNRSTGDNLGERHRTRFRTRSCCFRSRFSATTDRRLPGPSRRAKVVKA